MNMSSIRGREDYIYINAQKKHSHTLIFFHGLGDSPFSYENDFLPGGDLYNPNLRVVLPAAPKRRILWNSFCLISSWFNVYNNFDDHQHEDLLYIANNQKDKLRSIIANNIN